MSSGSAIGRHRWEAVVNTVLMRARIQRSDAAETNDARWARLMVAAQGGDSRSYGELLRDILPVLQRAARSRWPMAQPAEIDDAVQETLKSMHAVRHTYDGTRPFLPWLLAIAKYRVVDEQRKKMRSHQREVAIDERDETSYASDTNTNYSDADGENLSKAISQLPPRQRTAMELLKLKEMSLKEASEVSGMSVTALKLATHRAMKSLRAILGGPD